MLFIKYYKLIRKEKNIMKDYVKTSLELHLFFARIMKEHAIFLQAGFMPKNIEYIQEAMLYKRQFEKLLSDAVRLSNCMIRPNILSSGEIVTRFTIWCREKNRRTYRDYNRFQYHTSRIEINK